MTGVKLDKRGVYSKLGAYYTFAGRGDNTLSKLREAMLTVCAMEQFTQCFAANGAPLSIDNKSSRYDDLKSYAAALIKKLCSDNYTYSATFPSDPLNDAMNVFVNTISVGFEVFSSFVDGTRPELKELIESTWRSVKSGITQKTEDRYQPLGYVQNVDIEMLRLVSLGIAARGLNPVCTKTQAEQEPAEPVEGALPLEVSEAINSFGDALVAGCTSRESFNYAYCVLAESLRETNSSSHAQSSICPYPLY